MVSWTKLISGKAENGDRLRYGAIKGNIPVVVWNITRKCNLQCCHCYYDAAKEINVSEELNTREARNFIEDIAGFRVPVVLFSGGEPLLRDDIFELAYLARGKNISLALSTNGTLITEGLARKIQETGFSYVGISLDGSGGEVNDMIRGKTGAFQQTIEGIKNCQKMDLKVGLRFTMTKKNFRQIPEIFEMAEEFDLKRICFYHLVYSGRAAALQEHDLSHDEMRQTMEFIFEQAFSYCQENRDIEIMTVGNHCDGIFLYLKLKRINPQRAAGCLRLLELNGGNNSGIRLAAVDSRGNIYPDQFWRNRVLGNIREEKFSQVWSDVNNAFLAALRDRKPLLKGRCQKCGFFTLCNGNFRSRAQAVFADPWQEDPACYLSEKELNQRWN
jgi:radical SAM protein with 4Fe4S-binding SPASM domain